MSAYLARLKALTAKNREKTLPDEPSKPSKAAFEPFEGAQDRCVCRNDGPPLPAEAAQNVATIASVSRGRNAKGFPEPETLATVAGGEGQTAELENAPARLSTSAETAQSAAIDSVPGPYRDAFARLKCQWPPNVSHGEWRQAVNDAGRLFDAFTVPLFAQFQWTPGDIFDVPHDGAAGGLVWFLNGETVRSLGPEQAVTKSGRVFDRLTRAEWQNPYQGNQR